MTTAGFCALCRSNSVTAAGPWQTLADSINTLLINWLIKQIRAVDQEFGTFLREKGITIGEEA